MFDEPLKANLSVAFLERLSAHLRNSDLEVPSYFMTKIYLLFSLSLKNYALDTQHIKIALSINLQKLVKTLER